MPSRPEEGSPSGGADATPEPQVRWTRIAPSLLLVVVALHQVARASTHDLVPWKGGGFGMFATTDRPSARRVRAWAETSEGPIRLHLRGDLDNLRRRAGALPDSKRLDALARALEAQVRERAPEAHALRIEVWRTAFERGPLRPSGRRLARLERPLAEEPGGG